MHRYELDIRDAVFDRVDTGVVLRISKEVEKPSPRGTRHIPLRTMDTPVRTCDTSATSGRGDAGLRIRDRAADADYRSSVAVL